MGFILTVNCCKMVQPTVGGTIPQVGGPGNVRKLAIYGSVSKLASILHPWLLLLFLG